jgi:DNA-binding MarR family transcriptional regulator
LTITAYAVNMGAVNTTASRQRPATSALPGKSKRADFYRAEGWSTDESVGYLLRLSLTALARAADAHMRPSDLTSTQWSPLMIIGRGGNPTAATLARELNTDTGAMTRMLDRLERKGLLTRRRSLEDRRVVELELTDAGRAAIGRLPHVLAQVYNEHLRGFTPDEFAQLKDLLRRIIANSTREP